jgi:hypothetical protein
MSANSRRHSWMKWRLVVSESVALAAMSLAARRVLDRLTTEYLRTGAKDNARLRVSYAQLAKAAGVHEMKIMGVLAELVALGFLVIAHGHRPKGAPRISPNFYRLTFLPDWMGNPSSDEWRRFEPPADTNEQAWEAALKRAKRIAREARKNGFQIGVHGRHARHLESLGFFDLVNSTTRSAHNSTSRTVPYREEGFQEREKMEGEGFPRGRADFANGRRANVLRAQDRLP